MAGPHPPVTAFRLCLDLNVWVRQFIAEAMGRHGTASQQIIRAVFDGRAGIGPIQLIVSHTMLSRLQSVLMRLGADLDTSTQFIETVAGIALLGPSGEYPRMVLGGGVQPTREARGRGYDPYDPSIVHPPYDPEDGRVLDTAIAGRADALVTNDFKDFVHYSDEVVVQDRIHVRKTAVHDLWIVKPEEMAEWLRTGLRPAAVAG